MDWLLVGVSERDIFLHAAKETCPSRKIELATVVEVLSLGVSVDINQEAVV